MAHHSAEDRFDSEELQGQPASETSGDNNIEPNKTQTPKRPIPNNMPGSPQGIRHIVPGMRSRKSISINSIT
jgi:hypothetical protein